MLISYLYFELNQNFERQENSLFLSFSSELLCYLCHLGRPFNLSEHANIFPQSAITIITHIHNPKKTLIPL